MPCAAFNNTGLYNVDGKGAIRPRSRADRRTQKPADMGRFRAPTLRNVARHRALHARRQRPDARRGDRALRLGRRGSPYKSDRLKGFTLTPTQTADLVAFLESLTDSHFLAIPRLPEPGSPP